MLPKPAPGASRNDKFRTDTSLNSPHPKTWNYYVALVFVVLPFRSVVYLTPPALVILVWNQLGLSSGTAPLPTGLAMLLIGYCAAETLFSLYFLYSMHVLGRVNRNPAPITDSFTHRSPPIRSTNQFFDKVFRHIPNVEQFFEEHFFSVPFDQLTRRDFRNWFAFAFYGKDSNELTEEERRDVDTMIAKIFRKVGTHPPTEVVDEPAKPFCRPCMDPLDAKARPLLVYLLTFTLDFIGGIALNLLGFEVRDVGYGLTYWHRGPVAPARETAEPMVFVHGIGSGLVSYIHLIYRLATTHKNRQLFFLELPHVSMQLCDHVPTKEETLSAVQAMFAEHNITTGVHWMGHSLGSSIVSWVVQDKPELVSHVTLVDPVVLLLWKADIVFNIMYREPSNAVQVLMWYFVTHEIHIAHMMRRHFHWYESVLFPEDLPRHPETNAVAATVFLSSKDLILNSPAVYDYLQQGVQFSKFEASKNKIPAVLWEGITHGEMLLYPSTTTQVVDNVNVNSGRWKDTIQRTYTPLSKFSKAKTVKTAGDRQAKVAALS
ncbi:hypothetical protein LEN26_004814 [Aphanomyces euteiches]|nr:hypothetical protein LEN26_004814 [Aphanomyces euteiches]